MSLVQLDIVTPKRLVFSDDIRTLVIKAESGELGILANHIPMTATLAPGIARIIYENGEEKQLVITGGFMEVTRKKITVLAEEAEFPDEIDVESAERAKRLAEEQLLSEDMKVRDKARADLNRAAVRLKLANKE